MIAENAGSATEIARVGLTLCLAFGLLGCATAAPPAARGFRRPAVARIAVASSERMGCTGALPGFGEGRGGPGGSINSTCFADGRAFLTTIYVTVVNPRSFRLETKLICRTTLDTETTVSRQVAVAPGSEETVRVHVAPISTLEHQAECRLAEDRAWVRAPLAGVSDTRY